MFKLQKISSFDYINFSFAFLLISSLIQRYPFDYLVTSFKIVPFICSFLVFLIAFFNLPKVQKRLSLKYSLFILAFFILKFILASTVAYLKFQESIFNSLLEMRFGIFFIFTPILYFYFKFLDKNEYIKIFHYLIPTLLIFDLAALYFFSDFITPFMRGLERFHISAFPLLIMVYIFIERFGLPKNSNLIVFFVVILLLHSFIVSTSRTDILLCILGLIYILFKNKKINIFLNLNLIMISVILVFSVLFLLDLSRGNFLTGTREYLQFFDIIKNNFIVGIGSVRDATFNSFSADNYIWFSDFGIFLYPLRYGLVGWFYSVAVIWVIFISIFISRNTLLNQNIILFISFLYIITIKPMIEYAALESAILFAFIALRYQIHAKNH